MKAERTYTVFEVLFDTEGDNAGPMGDGTFIRRFHAKDEKIARAFAAENTTYGRSPASCIKSDGVPKRLAQRWGIT